MTIIVRCIPFVVSIVSILFSFCLAHTQSAADLQATIERHYAAINGNDSPTITSHHLPDMSIFFGNGSLLMDTNTWEAQKRVGLEARPWDANVFINGFKAQIYGNVGIALFYLTGSNTQGDSTQHGTWRVTAVWVYENGIWKEAHHHESPLVGLIHK